MKTPNSFQIGRVAPLWLVVFGALCGSPLLAGCGSAHSTDDDGTGGSAGSRAAERGGTGGGPGGSTGAAGSATAGAAGTATGGAGAMGGAGGSPTVSTANLIVNGDAEAAAGSSDGSPVTTPGWIVLGGATTLVWGAPGGYPQAADPGPTNRGKNLFAGGVNDAVSSFEQRVDLAPYATEIDGGRVTFTLSGFLGGFATQRDHAVVTLTFRSNVDRPGGFITASLADRSNVTGLFERTKTGIVPVGVRSVMVTLTSLREEGAANDGYADNLSLVLTGVASPSGSP